MKKSIRTLCLYALAKLSAEKALRAEDEHQEQRGKRHASPRVAAERHERRHLDQAEQVTSDDGAGHAAHTAQHDHGQAAHLDVVTPDVWADVAERDAEQDPGQTAERGG